jgi:hypothetical protein
LRLAVVLSGGAACSLTLAAWGSRKL